MHLHSRITAGASCGTAGLSASAIALGTYMTAKSGNGGNNDGEKEYKKTKSGLIGKERAKDIIPSWANGEKPYVGESGKEFAKRILDKFLGEGSYDPRRNPDFSKLRKYGDRNFENPN